MKATAVLSSVAFAKTHDLEMLYAQVPESLGLALDLRALASLSQHAVESRYPGDWDPVSREDAEDAIAAALAVRQAVRAHVPPGPGRDEP